MYYEKFLCSENVKITFMFYFFLDKKVTKNQGFRAFAKNQTNNLKPLQLTYAKA